MALVCLDTQILIWGIQGYSRLSQQDMIPKAQAFIRHLEDQKHHVMIPSVVVAELLLGIPHDQHVAVLGQFRRNFMIYPFDLEAAMHYAKIWGTLKSASVDEAQIKRGTLRSEVRTDCMIVATAAARGAACIYSNDDDIHEIAYGYIRAERMPEILTQMNLL